MQDNELKQVLCTMQIENIIFDIDNVLVDSTEWEKTIPADKMSREGWDRHHKMAFLVKSNIPMAFIIEDLIKKGLKNLFFITAREDINDMRNITLRHVYKAIRRVKDIEKINIYFYMRNAYDYRTSAQVKEDVLLNHIYPYYFIDVAIDDDMKNLEMFKNYNIKTLHYTKFSCKDSLTNCYESCITLNHRTSFV